MNFVMKIANVNIHVEHRNDYIRKLCSDYIVGCVPEVFISVNDEQVDFEFKQTGEIYPMDMCEATAIHREIVNALISRGIILMHSAVISVDGEAYVFMAKSGVGKSTHLGLWKKQFGERAAIVNGDKPMFSFIGDKLYAYGSPWKGKEGWGENISCPVKAICFLERGEKNIIEKVSASSVIDKLFGQVLVPKNPKDAVIFLELLDRITKSIPFYRLKCNMDPDAAVVSYDGMK